MELSKEIKRAVILSILAASLTVVPYLIADASVEQGSVFSGFLINPVDGFSYLAKMRQGSSGGWTFQLPYAPEPGEGVFIFTFYIMLGKVVNLTGLSPQFIYHTVRTIAAAGMFFIAYFLVSHFINAPKQRWRAYLLILFGSGFGWIATIFGMIASDLKIPESIPLYSAFANAHFPFATMLFLLIILVVLREENRSWSRLFTATLLSMVLALVQPFVFIVLGLVLGVWQLLEIRIRIRELGRTPIKAFKAVPWSSFTGLVLGALPWMIYDYALTINHEALSVWNMQNQTPSPPVIEFMVGYGGALLLTVIGFRNLSEFKSPVDRLLVVWAIIQPLLLYAPFNLQRRLSLGLYFPLAILAIIALHRAIRPHRVNLAFAVLFVLSLPSNLIVMVSGLAELNAEGGELIVREDELATYHWLAEMTTKDELVLANKKSGNRIPAFTNHRVLYGHPFETPYAEVQEDLIDRLLTGGREPRTVISELEQLGVRFVLISPGDQAGGSIEWLEEISLVFVNGEYAVYEMSK